MLQVNFVSFYYRCVEEIMTITIHRWFNSVRVPLTHSCTHCSPSKYLLNKTLSFHLWWWWWYWWGHHRIWLQLLQVAYDFCRFCFFFRYKNPLMHFSYVLCTCDEWRSDWMNVWCVKWLNELQRFLTGFLPVGKCTLFTQFLVFEIILSEWTDILVIQLTYYVCLFMW